MIKALRTVGRYFMLMGRTFSRPERMRMFFRQYLNEMEQLGVNSIGIVLLISFFIGAVITIQIKLNIAGVLLFYYVFDSGGKGRLEHCFRTGNDAGDAAD